MQLKDVKMKYLNFIIWFLFATALYFMWEKQRKNQFAVWARLNALTFADRFAALQEIE